jgi:hypothetical protein
VRLSNALSEKLMDVRLRDKLLTEGKISNNQVNDYLNKLPDDKSNLGFTEDIRQGRNEGSLNDKS